MKTPKHGKNLLDALIAKAHIFPEKSQLSNWVSGMGSTAATMASGASLFTEAGSIVTGPIASIATLFFGLSDIGRASLDGEKINALRSMVSLYANAYVDAVAKYAMGDVEAISNATFSGISGAWQKFAINNVNKALSELGENDGAALLDYLKNQYSTEEAIEKALLPLIINHSLQNADDKDLPYLIGSDSILDQTRVGDVYQPQSDRCTEPQEQTPNQPSYSESERIPDQTQPVAEERSAQGNGSSDGNDGPSQLQLVAEQLNTLVSSSRSNEDATSQLQLIAEQIDNLASAELQKALTEAAITTLTSDGTTLDLFQQWELVLHDHQHSGWEDRNDVFLNRSADEDDIDVFLNRSADEDDIDVFLNRSADEDSRNVFLHPTTHGDSHDDENADKDSSDDYDDYDDYGDGGGGMTGG